MNRKILSSKPLIDYGFGFFYMKVGRKSKFDIFISSNSELRYLFAFWSCAPHSVNVIRGSRLEYFFPHSGWADNFVLLWQLQFNGHDFEGSVHELTGRSKASFTPPSCSIKSLKCLQLRKSEGHNLLRFCECLMLGDKKKERRPFHFKSSLSAFDGSKVFVLICCQYLFNMKL